MRLDVFLARISWITRFGFLVGIKDGKGEDTESKARDDRLDEANDK